ncbi:MAG: homocysteine S-methyltransferase family protein [Treponema sp.]|jgi:5-methyltetrahydrofolate--homocysteine methyltransferase|nr:homocysteine S-methyltransferase family protein [Treponema sp.]
MDFLQRLGKERLTFDGAMGTMLQNNGLSAGELPELWNITHSGVVLDIHRSYVQAGCQILKANTFGANRLKLHDTGYSVNQVVSAGVAIARKAAQAKNVYAVLDIGPTGKLLAPFGDLDFEEAVSIFAEMITAGAQAGADLVLIETMTDTYEIKAAMLAAKENCSLPVLVTFTPDSSGRLLTGADILTAVSLIEGLGADALGFNCGLGPKQMKSLLPDLLKYVSIPVIINPNAGMPEQVNGKTAYRVTPDEFAADMADIAAHVQIIGGCCGTTPDHIAAMTAACRNIPLAPASAKNYTVVSSYGKTVMFGEKTVIVGERINPTGKPRMKKALYDRDFDYFCREGLAQAENGADILDVNVGLPDIDEAEMLAKVVTELQSVTNTVLQIDTVNAAAAERALRLYNGKPLLNSVSGKKESIEKILPLVKKYGAAVVALTLDDNGIPKTAQGRIRIAETIIAVAERYSIPKKDIIVDALTMTVSAGADNAKITLETVEHARHKLGVHTILGVSNVSFGLPEREHINAAFFTLAMNRGLSAGIVNPMNAAIMDAFFAYRALNGGDENHGDYIRRFSKQAAPAAKLPAQDAPPANLYDAIVGGLRDQAVKAANAMLDTPPLEIINNHLIPALDKTGKDFESNVIFLPQLLMSAEAAKSAFEAIKSQMSKQGKTQESRGKIVLATVKGDVHDIGKNIVKILLENYNFQVIDLGKNVEPAVIAETVLNENARLAGLSALMTTTVAYMEETIRLLKEKAPECRIMAGGAVLTQGYADKIGADFYSKDAMGGVRYADALFS